MFLALALTLPTQFVKALPQLGPSEVLVHVEQFRTQPYHRDPLRLYVNGKLVYRSDGARPPRTILRLFPKAIQHKPALRPPYASLAFVKTSGAISLLVEVAGEQGQEVHWTVALPKGSKILDLETENWERGFDSLSTGSIEGRPLVKAVTEVMTGWDALRIVFLPPSLGHPLRIRPKPAFRLATDDGLALLLSSSGEVAGLSVDNVSPPLTPVPSGILVGEALGEPVPIGGKVEGKGRVARHRSRLGKLGLEVNATYRALPNRIEIEGEVSDLTGKERGVDLCLSLPLDLAGWKFHHSILTKETIEEGSWRRHENFPLCAVTDPEGKTGFALAIPPDRPCNFSFVCVGGSRLLLSVRFGLSPLCKPHIKSRAPFKFVLFKVDGKWGYRDALRRYYALFPEAFRKRATKEGLWLFAFPAAKLPNPQDYAYREGGPAGWEVDEKLGLLTFPYIIPGQRQILLPRLPRNYAEAMEAFEKFRGREPEGWNLRGNAEVDNSVARTGGRSLKMSRAEGEAAVHAFQKVWLNQREPREFVISAWSKAEGVTGPKDKNYSVWGDVCYVDGTFLYGQAAPFDPGTHGWQRAEVRVRPKKPVAWVNVHLLLRGKHTGTVWFDDVEVREVGEERNLISNASFERLKDEALKGLIVNSALHSADGRYYIVIRDHGGADIKPPRPTPMVVFSVNPDPDLFADEGKPTVGRFFLRQVEEMLERFPRIDGIYLDSAASWCSAHLNFRRDHFRYADVPLTYDPRTGRVAIDGKFSFYEFMCALARLLHPKGKLIFPNLGHRRSHPWLFFAADVCGSEGGGRQVDEETLAYLRSAAYQKPVLKLHYLEIWGRRTVLDSCEGFEEYVKRCALFGIHPAIGRRCDEAYEKFGDIFRRYLPAIREIARAGWEPVTLAHCQDPQVRLERFGGEGDKFVYLAVYNRSKEGRVARIALDVKALRLPLPQRIVDLTSGEKFALQSSTLEIPLGGRQLRILKFERCP